MCPNPVKGSTQPLQALWRKAELRCLTVLAHDSRVLSVCAEVLQADGLGPNLQDVVQPCHRHHTTHLE